jgi:hypothetical protein
MKQWQTCNSPRPGAVNTKFENPYEKTDQTSYCAQNFFIFINSFPEFQEHEEHPNLTKIYKPITVGKVSLSGSQLCP